MPLNMTKINNVDCDKIVRNIMAEKSVGIEEICLYVYGDAYGEINIVGQIFAKEIRRSFELRCVVYDKDGDIILTEENFTYGGGGLVSNAIDDVCFFQGFPFRFAFRKPKTPMGVIMITPL